MPSPRLFSPYRVFTGVFIPDALVSYKGINAAEKICLARLYRYCGKSMSCWPSQEELASELGVEDRTVRLYIQHLEEDGFIRIEQRGLKETNLYWMVWHQVFDEESEQDRSGLDRHEFSGQDRHEHSYPDRHIDAGPLHLLTEESHTKRINTTSENIFDLGSMKWFSQRFRDAGKKLSPKEKHNLAEALCRDGRTESQIEAALSCFLADPYWKSNNFPPTGFLSQLDKYLEQSRNNEPAAPTSHPVPSATQEASGDVAVPADTPAPPAAARVAPAPHWRDAWLAMWNGIVTAMPGSEWDESDDKKLLSATQDPEFVKRFHEICTQAQAIHTHKSDCGYLTLQWVISPQKGETVLNWKKLFKSMAFMAKPQQMSGSGQKQTVDMKEVIRKAIEKNFGKKEDED